MEEREQRFNRVSDEVLEWAKQKGILGKSTPYAQWLKAMSELGELCDAVVKDDYDEFLDAVGDVAVTLVILEYKIVPWYTDCPSLGKDYPNPSIGQLADLVVETNTLIQNEMWIAAWGNADQSLSILDAYASSRGVDMVECLERVLYNVLVKRTGHMSASGAFIKDTTAVAG